MFRYAQSVIKIFPRMMPGKNIGTEKNLEDFSVPIPKKLDFKVLLTPLVQPFTELEGNSEKGDSPP